MEEEQELSSVAKERIYYFGASVLAFGVRVVWGYVGREGGLEEMF